MLDANFMFRLDGGRSFLHDRPAARALAKASSDGGQDEGFFCLISGERGPVARLHPTIKGIEGAQSSGAALVSFNLGAFTSLRSEEHTSELQSLMRISYAVFCLKKKKKQ